MPSQFNILGEHLQGVLNSIIDAVNGKAASGHTHDDRYYTETETNNLLNTKVNTSGSTLTGNVNWAQTDRGLTWAFNTDGAYIKFFNTGDGDTNSRLEFGTSDNGNEFFRWTIAGTEEATLKSDGLRVANSVYMAGNLVATQSWVGAQGYLTSVPAQYITQDTADQLYQPIGNYDNYGSWNLKTNGTQRTTVTSGGTLDIKAGTNVTVTYSAGGGVTIASTDTNTWRPLGTGATDAAAGNHTHAFSEITSKPTTLAGYGITDAASSSHTHAWTTITGRPTALSSFTNDLGNYGSWITASHLNDYSNGGYRVIADYGGSTTWYLRSNGQFIWGTGHDWTASFRLNIDNGSGYASNGSWAFFGQQDSNQAKGTWRGVRIRRYDNGAVDGDLSAGAYYVGDTRKDTNWDTAYSWGNHATAGYGSEGDTAKGLEAFNWGNHADAGYLTSLPSHTHSYLPLSGGTLTGDVTTSGNIKGANLQLSGATPTLYFNGTNDGGDYASSDMAIKATPEGLDFYEPEDGNKIHFQILDDLGVNSPYGYQWNGQSLDARYQAAGSYAASSHTHSYLPLSGGTLTGTLTGRDIVSSADRTYNLGADDNRWRIVFCETLDSAGLHEANLASGGIAEMTTGTVLVWKDGRNIPCTEFASHMRMGIAVRGNAAPLVQGAEPVLCHGEVNEGDYLVTSGLEGHATAVSRDFVLQHQLMDCIIGKALESGDGESHLVKTWITI